MVSRPRIERLLGAAWQRRVTLVVADAGYGKTTALRQLAADDRARWLGLRTGDREVETLATRIDEALGAGSRHTSAVERAAIGAADRRSLAEGRAALVCERLDSEKGELLLVLDDVDQLKADDSAAQFLTTLCLQAPSRLHIVLSGRELPMLGLGSARGRGELMELTARDLAFSPDETTSLLVDRLGPDADALADECWSLTAGWAAALQLIADRLERVSPARWREALEQLRQRRGTVWREFTADLVEREEQPAGRILAVASVAPTVEADLLAALGIAAAEPELDRLETRGLLVGSGELGSRALSPVLAEVVRDRLSAADTEALRRQTAAWFEQGDRLGEALECVIPGPRGEVQALLQRCGERLIGQAGGLRVAEVIRGLGSAEDLALTTLLAQALVAAGDWDGAMEVFATIRHNAGDGPLAAAVAWRLGALLYLRSEFEPAEEVLSAAYSEDAGTRDDALVAAWLAATLWGRGEAEQGERVATIALRNAEASGDAAARAAAHVSMALAAASQGDRERNERHYRLALNAATSAMDSTQLARIHTNLSSRAAEEGDYAGAIEEADLAISASAGHNLFSALAMSNKAEALMHTGELDEARGLLMQAIEMFTELGSLLVCAPYTQLGALDAERGDFARARGSLERAHRVAEQAGDVHALVFALAGLAEVLADEDPERARGYALEAARVASSLERANALCTRAWVELKAGNRDEAARLSREAQTEARRIDDSPSLARALELSGAAQRPADVTQLETAITLWREIGDPVATLRAELTLAAC